MKTLWRNLFTILPILFLSAMIASAQVETGQIAGIVTDPSGATVANANVTVKNLATNGQRTAHTSTSGSYLIPGLTPALYEVTISSGSFKPFASKVEVTVGSHVSLNANLSMNAASETVQVVAEGGAQVNTQSQEMSQVIDTVQMEQLPSLTRNPYDFVALSGNVSGGDSTTGNASGGQNSTSRGVGFAINGQRESGTEILLDGVENVAAMSAGIGENVPIDAVQEYSVITNNYSAEYGRASGGVVNVTTKPATNQYHGSVWEYNRLSAYTANTYANDAQNSAAGSIVAPKGKYTRNQFGFQGGGPIIKNKLFIIETTEWTRVRSAATETEEVFDPTFIALLPANAQAYFNSFGTGVAASTGVAATAGQLATKQIVVNNINGTTPVAATQPVFDMTNFTAPFDAGGGEPQNTYQLVGRVDYNLSDKTQMFFRGARENNDYFPGSNTYSAYSQYDTGTTNLNQSYLYSLAHTFSNTLFANAKASFTRFNNNTSFDHSLTYSPNLMFVTPTDPVGGQTIQMPGLENSSSPGNGGLPSGGPQNTIQFEPDLSWTKGKHSLRFGGLYTYLQVNNAYGAYAQAVEQLGSTSQDSMDDLVNADGNPGGSQLTTFSARVNPQGQLPCVANPGYWTSNSQSDLITNAACEVTPPLTAASYGRSYRYNDWAIYAQDSFRVSAKLTLNYGLRWEHYGVQHNNNQNLDSNFYYGSGSSIEEQIRNGNVQIANKSSVHGFWKPRWGTLAPRVGFAYDLFGDGRTSIRGGAGISYERNFGNVTYNASFNPPASAVLSSVCGAQVATCKTLVTNNDLGPLGVASGTSAYLPPADVRMPDPNINVAQTQFWSLALQHQLVRGTVVEAGYSGAHGVHLYDVEGLNLLGAGQFYLNDPLTFAASPDCASPCLNRPNDQYGGINVRGSRGGSSYNALNLNIQSENFHNTGLTLIANYTWSHSLDDLSSTFSDSLQGGSGIVGSLGYTSLADPKLDWGSSDFDVRHRISISPIWETPWLKHSRGIVGQVAGNWTLSGLFTARAGVPFSIFDYDNVLNGYTVPRLTPSTPITQYKVGAPQLSGPNQYVALTIPAPASYAPLDAALGISDFGPFPVNMTHRNAFRGPSAWNADMVADKKFKVAERYEVEFRAEGFDILNHHNYYVNTSTLAYGGPQAPMQVIEEKGGLGSTATGGNHDERRFGQFSLKLSF